MILQPIISAGHTRLTLLFAGWGMDHTPFRQYAPQYSDYTVCYDYSSADFDAAAVNSYESVHIVGWSMGVWAAACAASRITIPITGTAINGTPWPIDVERGIPPEIFHGTLRTLSEVTLQKFRRRMCGDAGNLVNFMSKAPERDIESLRSELSSIARLAQHPAPPDFWGTAYVAGRDSIFPAVNQKRAWEQCGTPVREFPSAAHYSEDIFTEVLQ